MSHERHPARFFSRHGFTLTEMAIVLGIIGLILGGIWAGASAVYNSWRIDRAREEIDTVINNMRTLYTGVPVYPAGDLTDNALKAGVFPADMVSGTTIANPWGGGPAGAAGISVGSQVGWGGCPSPANALQIVIWKMASTAEKQFLLNYVGSAKGDVTCIYADCAGLQGMDPVNIKLSDITPCTAGNNNGDIHANIVLTVSK